MPARAGSSLELRRFIVSYKVVRAAYSSSITLSSGSKSLTLAAGPRTPFDLVPTARQLPSS